MVRAYRTVAGHNDFGATQEDTGGLHRYIHGMSRLLRAFLVSSLILFACGDDIRDSKLPPIEYDREVSIPGQDGPVSALYDAQIPGPRWRPTPEA